MSLIKTLKNQSVLVENNKLTIRGLDDDTIISFGSIRNILHDNLRLKRVTARFVAHNALISREFLAKNNTITIQQAQNTAVYNFFLFDKVKAHFEKHFTTKAMKRESKEALLAVLKIERVRTIHRRKFIAGKYIAGKIHRKLKKFRK